MQAVTRGVNLERLKRIVPMFSIALAFIAAPATAWAVDAVKCNPAGTQLELNACAADELNKADQKLNEVYAALLKKEAKNTAFVQKLRAAQRAWIAFRDAELDATYACQNSNARVCWGSMLPLRYLSYKAQLTRERTTRLQQFLDKGQPADD